MTRIKERERFKNITEQKEEICFHPNLIKLEVGKEELTAFLSDGRKTSIPIN